MAGLTLAVVFALAGGHPWLQATVQVPIYGASAVLIVRSWWIGRRVKRDGLAALGAVAFASYFGASILGVAVPLTASSAAAVPVPSVLDVLFLSSYLLLAAFLWRVGSRSGAVGRRDGLDILIVIGGLAPLFWLLLMEPLLASGSFTPALATYLSYPTAVLILLAMTVRLAFVARQRTGPHLLLAGWVVFELSADVVFLRAAVNGTYVYGQSWQAMWIVSAACVGAAALHPRVGILLTRRQSRPVSGTRRLYLLAGSLATPVGTICYIDFVRESSATLLVPVVATFTLIALVSLRLSGLMVDNAAQVRVQERMARLSEDLEHQALHDPLTGLGNRVMFATRLDDALAQRAIAGDRATVLLLLDLDDFKTINDTFGHQAGDRVLVEVSRRLSAVSRQGEAVYRLGGDEFALVLSQASLPDALRLADRIGLTLAEPFDLGPRLIRPFASIGIAIALGGQDASALLSEADMAMYEGKARSSQSACVFDPVLHTETLARHQLERDLRDAVARGELRLLYQPLVHLASHDIVGVEALVRWEHPTRGTISPLDFIPIAEANGAILEIGDWVLAEAVRQLQDWDQGWPSRRLKVSVNVSPRQLADPEFVERTGKVLEACGLHPARLNLEITEAALDTDVETMIGRLHQLKALGVTLAIDDFGTEYSSLSHLRRLPIDILKIDKSFIDGIATEPAEWALTTAIIRLAKSLKKTTVAEGIETGAQLAHLRTLKVDLGQGYLFARPLDPAGIGTLLDFAPGRAFLH